MLGFLKRIAHRGEDLDDIRGHVLGERFAPEFEPAPPFPAQPVPGRQGFQPEPAYQPYQPFGRPQPLPEPEPEPAPRFESRYGEEAGAAFGEPFGGAPAQLGRAAEKVSRDYDVLDRLNLIESQLSAIRSMTETINERLKNLETKLGLQRRY